jgi:serine/threonine protein kinase
MDDHDTKTMKQVSDCGYKPIRKKGQGTYGVVYEVGDMDGDLFAFKYILPDPYYKIYGIDNLNEIDILSRVNHPYIIHAPKIITARNCKIDGIAVILPLADRTLNDIIGDVRATTETKIPIIYKLATALEFLHRAGILHLDIKGSNVVLQDINANHPYLIDFGLSMFVDDASIGRYNSDVLVTIDHRPPEILAGGRMYNAAVDVWSFGIMMLYILSGQRNIFPGVDFNMRPEEFGQLVSKKFSTTENIEKLLSNVREKYRNNCIDLISRILSINPILRPTAKEICNHPLFNDFRHPVEGTLSVPPIYHDYPKDHRDILKVLIHWARNIYPKSRAQLMFLAVDLFNRMGSFFKDKTDIQRIILAATCLWMAAKLLNDGIRLDEYVVAVAKMVPDLSADLSADKILETEIEIIHTLEGVLNVSQIYRTCSDGYELELSFQNIIISKDSTLYSRVDLIGWSKIMKESKPNKSLPTKDIKISSLIP